MNRQKLLIETIADLQKELYEIIAASEIPKGTLGYVSDSNPNDKSKLRYLSYIENGEHYCFNDVVSDGSALCWKYFTPLDEAILGRLIPHDGSSEYKGHPEDFVWPMCKDGKMFLGAGAAIKWDWSRASGYYLIKKGGE